MGRAAEAPASSQGSCALVGGDAMGKRCTCAVKLRRAAERAFMVANMGAGEGEV